MLPDVKENDLATFLKAREQGRVKVGKSIIDDNDKIVSNILDGAEKRDALGEATKAKVKSDEAERRASTAVAGSAQSIASAAVAHGAPSTCSGWWRFGIRSCA